MDWEPSTTSRLADLTTASELEISAMLPSSFGSSPEKHPQPTSSSNATNSAAAGSLPAARASSPAPSSPVNGLSSVAASKARAQAGNGSSPERISAERAEKERKSNALMDDSSDSEEDRKRRAAAATAMLGDDDDDSDSDLERAAAEYISPQTTRRVPCPRYAPSWP